MSGTIDSMIYHPLEKAIEQDFEDDQDYAGRHLGELTRFDAGTYPQTLGNDENGTMARVGGLSLDLHFSGDLLVRTGYLMQVSGTLPSVIGPLDSTARVGLLLADYQVTVPDLGPGVDRYYLVQARVVESIASENRDIFNTTLQAYDPPALITKRKTHTVEISLKVGGAVGLIPTVDAGYTAIGAVFKSESFALTTANFVDLRPLERDQVGVVQRTISSTANHGYPISQEMAIYPATNTVMHGRWAAVVNGFLASMRTPTAGTNPGNLKHSSDADVTGRWYYIYLGQNPLGLAIGGTGRGRVGNAYATTANMPAGNAVMAVSSVAPVRGMNGASVPLVAPFEGVSAGAGTMVCVGVLRKAASGWDAIRVSAGGDATIGRLFVGTLGQNSGAADGANRRAITIDLATGGTAGERLLPVNAVSARGDIATSGTNTTGTARQVEFTFDDALTGNVLQYRGPWITTVRASNKSLPFDVPIVDASGASMFMRLWALTDADVPSAASTAAIGTDNTWGMSFTGFTLR